MSKKVVNNVKLGVFVLAGLLFLIFLLYMIGNNHSLFGSNFGLKAKFENVQGLKPGNNVRYAGIDIGTVRNITILNDTTLEVVMTIDEKMKSIIQKNALVSIGTDGLVGNKVVNIESTKQISSLVEDGDILPTKVPVNTDEVIQTLSKTNQDISIIAEELKATVQRINSSDALWSILNAEDLPRRLSLSVENVHLTTAKAYDMINELYAIVDSVKKGKGTAGAILTDTTLAHNLNEAISKIQEVGDSADSLLHNAATVVDDIQNNINHGGGPVSALLKDTAMTAKIDHSLHNIQEATEKFDQNMEALKHNFLFRKYFRNLEKKTEN
ncbi:MCE family protein [Membranicola marinus]|uniref:MCE family protein n=1 Tax=Membranihabitans marinus TaxID=1227546 RepID=A0A953HVL9_9BACT|nr:MlaD family protein [Membranihabitans marinus]MBY5959001.1 MCE family protein [Membranihabitans marinus]